jgi:hypothetical protein
MDNHKLMEYLQTILLINDGVKDFELLVNYGLSARAISHGKELLKHMEEKYGN